MKMCHILCFSCGRIGHATTNYDDITEVAGVAYKEELRASPPHRTKEITVKPLASRVVRPLFQVADMSMQGKSGAGDHTRGGTSSETMNLFNKVGKDGKVSKQDEKGQKFVNIVKELHIACNSTEASWVAQGFAGRERVSFGTNMSMEDDSSDGARWTRK
jgi:hypothetical protein